MAQANRLGESIRRAAFDLTTPGVNDGHSRLAGGSGPDALQQGHHILDPAVAAQLLRGASRSSASGPSTAIERIWGLMGARPDRS